MSSSNAALSLRSRRTSALRPSRGVVVIEVSDLAPETRPTGVRPLRLNKHEQEMVAWDKSREQVESEAAKTKRLADEALAKANREARLRNRDSVWQCSHPGCKARGLASAMFWRGDEPVCRRHSNSTDLLFTARMRQEREKEEAKAKPEEDWEKILRGLRRR